MSGSSQQQVYSVSGRRLILVAEDEMINREILGEILRKDYEVLMACDGAQAMDMIRENRGRLSMVLLDILMPVKDGLEVLREMKADPALARIPVIVTTAERETEVESLSLGAIDFIPKPYPPVDVILARILRTIELSEDRDIIQSTERDELTGLYNREYFYRYAEQFDQYHPGEKMDALLLDVNHFHTLNERYGKSYGDEVLRKIGEQVSGMVSENRGIGCRLKADTFMVYCLHQDDYFCHMERVCAALQDEDAAGNRVRLRMGVYPDVDKSIDMERRFDRAKMAADTIKGNLTKTIGFYDSNMHDRELYAEQLIEAFPEAIEQNQFTVYYQPKFDVRPDIPVLSSAEALVRWNHPELGMISPGVFVPLFEENGLIQRLDSYVWRETARQIREWKDRLGYSIPVSVNVSRVDLYDPALLSTLKEILEDFALSGRDLFLEVTESAYTRDTAQIVEIVEELRNVGFRVEMDDFGTGYSSLNMISSLPIDALKLDMSFVRGAFCEGGNTHMLEVIIGISDYLSVPVIAEGVETQEQLHTLKELGCDYVQGYFFSKPVPSKDFEAFILQKEEADLAIKQREKEKDETSHEAESESMNRKAKLNVLRRRSESGEEEEEEVQEQGREIAGYLPGDAKEQTGLHLRTASIFFVLLGLLAAAGLLLLDFSVARGYHRMEAASDRYIAAQLAAADMESGSDYLTDRVRCFVVTGEVQYLEDFFEEVETTRRRDQAVENLEKLLDDSDSTALTNLNTALSLSNELVDVENHAMRLMVEAGNYDIREVPAEITSIPLSEEELVLSPQEMKAKAQDLVFDNNYMHHKDRIRESVSLCTQALIRVSSQELEQASAQLSLLVRIQTIVTILFLMIVLSIVLIIVRLILKPLTNMVRKMQSQELIMPTGVEELRFVTRSYNQILLENQEAREKLSHEASHDALTGLFNRGAYDLLMQSTDKEHMALILIDVDEFKGVNDTYGHDVGDRVLKRVAEILKKSFRSVDILCRIGGDEFAVVMTRANSSMSQLVINKIERANDLLQHPKDDLPPVSLSVGVAFSDRRNPQGDIFKDADNALYEVKKHGRKGCRIAE